MDWFNANAWGIKFLFDIGIFIGIAWLVYINKFHYNQSLKAKDDQIEYLKRTIDDRLEAKDEQVKVKDDQIRLKEAQIALLEKTQVEKFVEKFEAQRNLFKEMEEGYIKEIDKLQATQAEKDELIAKLREMVNEIETATEKTTLETSGWISAFGPWLGMMGHVGALPLNPYQGGMAQTLSKAKDKK